MRFKTYFIIAISFWCIEKTYAQWREQFITKRNQAAINTLNPLDDNDAWFVSGGARDVEKLFHRTNSGGAYYWSGLITNLTSNYDATTLCALNTQTAIIGFSGRSFNATSSLVYRTNNGGVSWKNITPVAFNSSVLVSVTHFFDYSNGLVFSDDNINKSFTCYVTPSGGAYWSQVWKGNMVTRQTGEFSRPLRDFNGDNVWIYSVNLMDKKWRLLHTPDKGYSWDASDWVSDDKYSPLDFAFCNDTEGVLVPSDNTGTKPFYRTRDGGMTWIPMKSEQILSDYIKQSICHVKGTRRTFAAAFLRNDSLFTAFTSDFGRNWYGWELVQYEKDQQCKDIAFATTSSGWISGGVSGSRVFKWKGDITSFSEFQINETDNSVLDLKISREQEKTEEAIQVYPNPAKDFVNINFTSNETVESVSLLDMYGRRVKMAVVDSNLNINWDTQDLHSGQYIIEYRTAKGVFTKKLVISK